jgi:miniconductance mechanosensitive channel
MLEYFQALLTKYAFSPLWVMVLANLGVLGVMVFTALLSHWIARRLLLPMIEKLVKSTENNWDEVFFEHKAFHVIPHMVPVTVLSVFTFSSEALNIFLSRAAAIYILILALIAVQRVFRAIEEIYNRYDISRVKPIKTYLQVILLVLAIMAVIVALAVLFNRSPLTLISGLGAMTAVLLLIFKDPIIGFVAGIQLMVNRMIRLGDWIEMPDFKADGEVIEMNLTTVKVRNWDLTITTIPIAAMTAGSFRNWRGMEESGGRRIKRSLLIDVRSICFSSEEEVSALQKIKLLENYLPERKREIQTYNQRAGFNSETTLGGRALTNIGIFRAYALRYIQSHSGIHPNMTIMVRQLQSNEFGLPLEIYAFTNKTAWVEYEGIQSDIFDHLVAMVPIFGLRLYQRP